MFDRDSAQQVDSRVQDALFIMAVSNSCMNPLVYGSYAINFRRECKLCFGRRFGGSRRCRSPGECGSAMRIVFADYQVLLSLLSFKIESEF
jgi:hypothetical protein